MSGSSRANGPLGPRALWYFTRLATPLCHCKGLFVIEILGDVYLLLVLLILLYFKWQKDCFKKALNNISIVSCTSICIHSYSVKQLGVYYKGLWKYLINI